VTNIILITNGSRPRLLEQTLRTLEANTPADHYTLTLICDGPVLPHPWGHGPNRTALALAHPCHIIGRLKNLGAYWSEKQFGRGEWLCFLDDDMSLFPGWLWKMERAIKLTGVGILGSVRHPYHGVNAEFGIGETENDRDRVYKSWTTGNMIPSHVTSGVDVTDAVAGYCHFMKWATWDSMGPYDGHAIGIGQSEDWKICNDIVQLGGKVGYIHPPVMAHCGLTASNGKPAIGSEQITRAPGVYYE
jgi:hypothetical protein